MSDVIAIRMRRDTDENGTEVMMADLNDTTIAAIIFDFKRRSVGVIGSSNVPDPNVMEEQDQLFAMFTSIVMAISMRPELLTDLVELAERQTATSA